MSSPTFPYQFHSRMARNAGEPSFADGHQPPPWLVFPSHHSFPLPLLTPRSPSFVFAALTFKEDRMLFKPRFIQEIYIQVLSPSMSCQLAGIKIHSHMALSLVYRFPVRLYI